MGRTLTAGSHTSPPSGSPPKPTETTECPALKGRYALFSHVSLGDDSQMTLLADDSHQVTCENRAGMCTSHLALCSDNQGSDSIFAEMFHLL